MYADHRPPHSPSTCTPKVLVLERKDFPCDIDEVMATGRGIGAVNECDGETFWVVFAEEPRRAWDFTETSLRSTLRGKNREAHEKGENKAD